MVKTVLVEYRVRVRTWFAIWWVWAMSLVRFVAGRQRAERWALAGARRLLRVRVLSYPQTAAKASPPHAYGTWTAGYLCNESSDLAAEFGSTTLDASAPTYSNQAARRSRQ